MNIGIIGSGLIAKDFLSVHRKAFGLNVCAICSRSIENAKRAAQLYDIERVYQSPDELLMDEKLDFIYIAVPNNLHFEYAEKALSNGKNVVLEKPFAVKAGEARELSQLAKEKGLYLFEAITNLYNPTMGKIEQFIKESENVKKVRVSFTQRSSRYDDFKNGIIHPVFSAEMNGGVLMDLGVYNLHIVNYLFGIPKRAEYEKRVEKGVDVNGIIRLYYDGFTAECPISKTATSENGIFIETDRGFIKSTSKPNSMDEVIIAKDGKEEVYTAVGGADRLLYQWESFCDTFERRDYKKMLRMLEYTCGVCEIVDMLS